MRTSMTSCPAYRIALALTSSAATRSAGPAAVRRRSRAVLSIRCLLTVHAVPAEARRERRPCGEPDRLRVRTSPDGPGREVDARNVGTLREVACGVPRGTAQHRADPRRWVGARTGVRQSRGVGPGEDGPQEAVRRWVEPAGG